MFKLYMFFLVLWFGWTWFGSIAISDASSGGATGSFVSTALNGTLSSTSTTITVTSTAAFAPTDFLWIDQEKVLYTGKNATQFTGVSRGQNGTVNVGHASGTTVYAGGMGLLNIGSQMQVPSTSGTFGTVETMSQGPGSMLHVFSVLFNPQYSQIFTGSTQVIASVYALFTVCLGLYTGYLFLNAFGGLFRAPA